MAKRRKIEIPKKIFETKQDFEIFVESERKWMYDRILEAIKTAYSRGETEAVIFEAKIEESMTVIVMNSDLEDWINSLSLALKWYENEEEYEVCSEITKLIDNIKTIL